jgi:hypothetical protein
MNASIQPPISNLEPATSFDEMIDLIGATRVARGLSYATLDELVGLTRGHSEKILGPARVRGLSPVIFDALLPALGIRFAVISDPEAIARMQKRWEPRDESNVRNSQRISRRLLDRARPFVLQELAGAIAAVA